MIEWGRIPAVLAFGLVISVGCGGRTVEGDGESTGSGGGRSGGGSSGAATHGGAAGRGGAGSAGAAAGGKANGGAGGSGLSACQSCLQTSCAADFAECSKDAGCVAIFRCVETAKCQVFDCYGNATCRKVIDQHGGFSGPSMNRLIETSVCSLAASCPCP